MPKVPQYDSPTVAATGLPDAMQRTPQRLIQTADLGPGEMLRVGNQMQAAGADFAKIATEQQATLNEATTKEGDTRQLFGQTTIMHDPNTGYLNQQGANAVAKDEEGKTPADKAIEALQVNRQKIMDGMQNDAQRQMFKQVSDQRIAAATVAIREHESRQLEVYEQAASQARANASKDLAIKSYTPGADENSPANTLYRQGITAQHIELENQADMKGITDPALRDQYIKYGPDGKSGMASAYVGVVTNLLSQNNTQGAQQYFDRIKEQLPADMQDTLQGHLKAADTADRGLKTALDVKAATPDIGEQEDTLDQMFREGKIDAQVRNIALQQLRADSAQQRGEQSENDKNVLGRVWDLKNRNPNATVTDLSRSDYAYIESRGLGQHVDSILSSSPAKDDAKMFNDLMRMSVDDPVNFTKTDLVQHSGQLSKAHWNHLVETQTSIGKQDNKAMEINKLVDDTVKNAKADLLAAGLKVNQSDRTAGSNAAAKFDQFETSLRDTLVAAQQSKTSGPLSREEARTIAVGMLKDQALSGGFFSNMLGLNTKPIYKMTPEDKAQPWDIPPAERAQIAQKLSGAGLPTSEANVQRYYKASRGVR